MKTKSSLNRPVPAERRFLSDVQDIRERARQRMRDGSVTPNFRGDASAIASVLNEALATETVCVLRYWQHYYVASGMDSPAIADEFREHALEEQRHADWLAERIHQLGGIPDLDPHGVASRSHSHYVPGETLAQMIEENLFAERIAIESYREIIEYIADTDPTSRRIMERILAKEEEHANDMAGLLDDPLMKRVV